MAQEKGHSHAACAAGGARTRRHSGGHVQDVGSRGQHHAPRNSGARHRVVAGGGGHRRHADVRLRPALPGVAAARGLTRSGTDRRERRAGRDLRPSARLRGAFGFRREPPGRGAPRGACGRRRHPDALLGGSAPQGRARPPGPGAAPRRPRRQAASRRWRSAGSGDRHARSSPFARRSERCAPTRRRGSRSFAGHLRPAGSAAGRRPEPRSRHRRESRVGLRAHEQSSRVSQTTEGRHPQASQGPEQAKRIQAPCLRQRQRQRQSRLQASQGRERRLPDRPESKAIEGQGRRSGSEVRKRRRRQASEGGRSRKRIGERAVSCRRGIGATDRRRVRPEPGRQDHPESGASACGTASARFPGAAAPSPGRSRAGQGRGRKRLAPTRRRGLRLRPAQGGVRLRVVRAPARAQVFPHPGR